MMLPPAAEPTAEVFLGLPSGLNGRWEASIHTSVPTGRPHSHGPAATMMCEAACSAPGCYIGGRLSCMLHSRMPIRCGSLVLGPTPRTTQQTIKLPRQLPLPPLAPAHSGILLCDSRCSAWAQPTVSWTSAPIIAISIRTHNSSRAKRPYCWPQCCARSRPVMMPSRPDMHWNAVPQTSMTCVVEQRQCYTCQETITWCNSRPWGGARVQVHAQSVSGAAARSAAPAKMLLLGHAGKALPARLTSANHHSSAKPVWLPAWMSA